MLKINQLIFNILTLVSLDSRLIFDSFTSVGNELSTSFVFALNFIHGFVLLRVKGSSIFFPLLALSSSYNFNKCNVLYTYR